MVEVPNKEENLRVEERFLTSRGYIVDYPKKYRENLEYRLDLAYRADMDVELQGLIIERCRRDIWYFFNVWLWTPDPRREVRTLPFITYEYQDEYLMTMEEAYVKGEDLLTEKSRDMGASMMVLGFVLHKWLFESRFSALLGSYIETLVDNKTEDSHFGRLDYQLDRLPLWMKPKGFVAEKHRNSMKLENPENESIISGYAPTDRFSRAGRYNLVFADEFAFWKHARSAWTAMGDATKVRFVTSTPNGKGNKYGDLALKSNIKKASLHWRRHPLKPEEWYEEQKQRRTPEEIAQELDINYNKSLTGRVYGGFDEWNYNEKQEYNPSEPLFVSWDFGLADPTALIWLQVTKEGMVRVIDTYEKSGEDIGFFVPFVTGVITTGGKYKYTAEDYEMINRHSLWQSAVHYGDPTGDNKVQAAKVSVIGQLREQGVYINYKRGKEFKFKQRYTATQMLIKRLKVDKDQLQFIDSIESARFPTKNETSQSTSETQLPVHDWTSHFRTALEFYAVNENLKVATKGKIVRGVADMAESVAEKLFNLYPKDKRTKSKQPYKTCA